MIIEPVITVSYHQQSYSVNSFWKALGGKRRSVLGFQVCQAHEKSSITFGLPFTSSIARVSRQRRPPFIIQQLSLDFLKHWLKMVRWRLWTFFTDFTSTISDCLKDKNFFVQFYLSNFCLLGLENALHKLHLDNNSRKRVQSKLFEVSKFARLESINACLISNDVSHWPFYSSTNEERD